MSKKEHGGGLLVSAVNMALELLLKRRLGGVQPCSKSFSE